MTTEILSPPLHRGGIGGCQAIFLHTSVHSQGPNRDDADRRLRLEARKPALDVEEFFAAKIAAEAGPSPHELGPRHAQLRRRARIADGRAVADRPTGHEPRP